MQSNHRDGSLDTVTQVVLGASIAGVCAPSGHRRKALLMGAGLGILPDLDALIDYGDPVANFTYHRGFSHSLFVLVPFSILLWLILRRWWAPVRAAPLRWQAAIGLALVTHPLLDAHTVYGTQLLWPLTTPPVMWSTLFIIDPLYTLPILVGVLLAAFWPARKWSGVMLSAGLILSTAYIGWSWTAKVLVERRAEVSLAAMDLQDAPRFSVPTPFNTLLWRVVVLTEDGYLEGFDRFLVDKGPISFERYASDKVSLETATNVWAVSRLRWFARDFLKVHIRDDRLVLSDLRMGQEPNYVFSHVVAVRVNPHWEAMPPEQIRLSLGERALSETWERLWADR